MTPNLFVATQTLFQPHKWFRHTKTERSSRKTEQWQEPVPGVYEYIPARGWYLIATCKDVPTTELGVGSKEGGPVGSVRELLSKEMVKTNPPVAVKYSKVLKKYLLAPDYALRKKNGMIKDSRGKMVQKGFFQLDDGVAWVNCWDEEGEFIPGPYKLWCIDANTDTFRHMVRRDDPEYQRSHGNSAANSRQNSFDHNRNPRRRSQESRSTEFRGGAGSTRDGQSLPSTRANSVRNLTTSNPTSNAPSLAGSRRGSLSRAQRSPRIPLDEAKAALSVVAREQAAKERARGSIAGNDRKVPPAQSGSLTVE